MSVQPEASGSVLPKSQPPLCVVCHVKPAIYTCPRCNMRTCSMPCANQHKSLADGCSGVRNKAAYVSMNKYGYMALMSDYTFLEEMGRQLDFRDIEMEMLPNGMERRILNQSTWDFKNRTALLTIELKFHPPPDPLQPSSQQKRQPFSLLTHRNALERPLLEVMRAQVAERKKSKKGDPFPTWISSLIVPDPDDPEGFTMPICVMQTPLDPLASLDARRNAAGPRPGHVRCEAYYKLDPAKPIGVNLKHKNFVEFPTIEIWEEGSFHGTIVDDQGSVQREAEEPTPKRRKLSVREGKKAINGLLGGYGSEEEEDDGLLDEDAEGETDDELEAGPEDLAVLLEQLRQAGALRDPEGDEEQVDWGDSGDEHEDVGA
ncbi:uncharacterized protein B0H18DRAFT_1205524 [Fomitopsis serialis]|uniref:uncharacterized protein n=1 Tax=Fomitopsis serialis TaxID=139415 RepID=UPI0020084692|nr:uncharacterized protein B0H18DRAFT_1205524 [Neoantrodia serialis]KAH9938252.1 hypothetical protein B0H18DRAFT_1205524 [Neoantrodia serialis]